MGSPHVTPPTEGRLRWGADPWFIDTRDYSVATLMDLGSVVDSELDG